MSVEQPNHHHRQGKGQHFKVTVQMSVPGDTLVADRESPEIVAHEDLERAIRDTFAAALRILDTPAKKPMAMRKATLRTTGRRLGEAEDT